ncbi:MAG: VOC family protein [Gallionellaceae bacterium]|nr:VOC family protein [Gallionellaceae bacterium]
MFAGLHHATFLSSDLARSRVFYENVLGLTPDLKRPNMSFDGFWYDISPNQQIHLMLLPNPEAGLQRPSHGGRDRHVALLVSDWGKLIERLTEGAVPYTVSQSGRQALFCRDPDGNALEFIAA